ncbi:MFS transporter [Candidatus Woesearchaeota archaeon]|nr:MFS transporter [Candidatus Woesearchaeota archaeon]
MFNKKIIAWALYDLANTAFTSPFVTIFWPLLVTEILHGNEFHLGLTVAVGLFFFGILIPAIGLISDNTNIRKPFIIVPTIAMIVIIAILPGVNLFWNLVLAGIVTILYNISLSIYNTILPLLAADKDMGKVSGFGMAAGFTGTILSMLIAYLTLKFFETDTIKTAAGIKAVFPVIAIFFLIFSIPMLFIFKDEKVRKLRMSSSEMLFRIFNTLKGLFRIRGMLPFLAYFGLFSNALAAIDIFFFLYAQNEIGMQLGQFILLFMGQSIGACIGALILGRLSDKYGAKNMLAFSTITWIFVVGVFISSRNINTFWIVGLIGSIAFGGSMANARTLFVFLTPGDKIGEFFGYSQIVNRLAAIIGPLIGGWLIVSYGYNAVLFMIMAFIVFSLFYLFRVPDLRSSSKT